MVKGNTALKQIEYNDLIQETKLFNWTDVSIHEIFNNHKRLEASAYSIEAKVAKHKLLNSQWGAVNMWSEKGYISDCFYGNRAKRDYVPRSTTGAIGFIGSSEMLSINPKSLNFLSPKNHDLNDFKVKRGTILISRSGTIGNVTLVNNTLSQLLVSEHAIRIIAKQYEGYVYAFLKTETGKTLVKSNVFGSVVDQIEPLHFKNVLIPNAPEKIKKAIHDLIIESYDLRDQSNDLIDKAEQILYKELNLKPLEELKVDYYNKEQKIKTYSTKLSQTNLRLDGSYHLPLYDSIFEALKSNSQKVINVKDKDISKSINLPGRFKRTYVDEENGMKFIGGKQIAELNPITEKYLSKSMHSVRLEELTLVPNSILITRSGTIGKVNIVPRHWNNWAANEHIIRVYPTDSNVAGYLYCWLNSDYGLELIRKHTYGSVVNEIDTNHVGDILIPILKKASKQKEINDLVLKANELRYQAHLKEQKAIQKMEEIIEPKVRYL